MFDLSLPRFDEKNKLCVYGYCDKCSLETESESADGTRIFLLDKQDQEKLIIQAKDLQPIACYSLDNWIFNPLGGRFHGSNTDKHDKMTKASCLDFCRKKMFSYAGIFFDSGPNKCLCGDLLPDESKKLTELELLEVDNFSFKVTNSNCFSPRISVAEWAKARERED